MSFSIQDFAVKNSPLTIAVGADHGGFEAKKELVSFLSVKGYEVIDCGPFAFDAADDYSDFGCAAGRAVSKGCADAAILICRSGIGMSIAANRFHGVRSVVAEDVDAEPSAEPQVDDMEIQGTAEGDEDVAGTPVVPDSDEPVEQEDEQQQL